MTGIATEAPIVEVPSLAAYFTAPMEDGEDDESFTATQYKEAPMISPIL